MRNVLKERKDWEDKSLTLEDLATICGGPDDDPPDPPDRDGGK